MKRKTVATYDKDSYFVALKVFLERNGKLLITKDRYGDWDIPGGRIRRNEFTVPLEKVIARKVREELGVGVHYRLGKPIIFMRHERREAGLGNRKVRIFAVGYQASLLRGVITLSPMHTEYRWINILRFNPRNYFTGGWLKGMQEYKRLRRKVYG